MQNVKVFPLLKRHPSGKINNIEEIHEDELTDLSNHYMSQIVQNLSNHGFILTSSLCKDLSFIEELIKSSLMRSVGQYHPLQEMIDDIKEEIEKT
jgi:hypothetical protein